MKSFKILLALAALALAFAGCKKDDDSSPGSKSFKGVLAISGLPSYVKPGDSFTFKCDTLSVHDEDRQSVKITYRFKNSIDNKYDTTLTYKFTVPDTTGAFTVSVAASANGYYTRTVTLNSTVVSSKSIKGAEHQPGEGTFTDGDNTYHFTHIGSLDWMNDNLQTLDAITDTTFNFGCPYQSSAATAHVFGCFYTWQEAQTACPAGWRLPTAAEFASLGVKAGHFMVDATYHGSRLWEFWPKMGVDNALAFYAMPFGYATIVDKKYTFAGFKERAMYWIGGTEPSCFEIYVDSEEINVWTSPSATDFAAQVRCVR